jgi:ketosteroid isomerase-like protein
MTCGRRLKSQVMAAFKAGDAAAIASLYSDTAKMLPPDATEIAGREAIQKLWQGWLDEGLKKPHPRAVEIEASGDLAYEIGSFSLQAPAENNSMVTSTGNYVVVWKRGADGNRRLRIDTWNDAPSE